VLDVVPVDTNPIVSVASHLFVPHSERVQDLVNCNCELNDRTHHDGKSAKMQQQTTLIQIDIEPHRCHLYHQRNHQLAGSNLIHLIKFSRKIGCYAYGT